MTLTDHRPVSTGLTTVEEGFESFEWRSAPGVTTPAAKPISAATRELRLAVGGLGGTAPLPLYIRDIERKINSLFRLRADWNHRGAREVTDEAALATVRILLELMRSHSLPVQLFPLPDGGIQAEWHVSQSSVEIEIDSSGDVFVSVVEDGEIAVEADLGKDLEEHVLSSVRQFLEKASQRALVR